MARRNREIHPSLVEGGFPEHGEEMPDEGDAFERSEAADEGVDDDGPEERPSTREEEPAYIRAMRDEIAALRADNNTIKRAVPPPEPVRDEPDEVDIDELLFRDPKEALRLTREQVKAELRAEYTREQGTSRFWTDFFAAHADLKDDRDLVELELSKNMDRLGSMDVKKAIDELADLTRQRILGYTRKGSGGRKQSRAVAEGANSPSPRAPAAPPSNVRTLTDLLRDRREKRRKGASAA